jgi:hypothetical protein
MTNKTLFRPRQGRKNENYTPPPVQRYEDFGLPSPELFFNVQPEAEDDVLTGLLSPGIQSLFGDASLESLPLKRWAMLLMGSVHRVDYIPVPAPPRVLPALPYGFSPEHAVLAVRGARHPHDLALDDEFLYWLARTTRSHVDEYFW